MNGLKHNLLSIFQLCDKGNKVEFTSKHCRVISTKTNDIILEGYRHNNVFKTNLSNIPDCSINCLSVLDDNPWLWHRRFGHVSQTLLQKLNSQNLVIGLPKTKFVVDKVCKECAKCKHVRSSFKPKQIVSTTRPLELVHVDLCGPVRLQNRNSY